MKSASCLLKQFLLITFYFHLLSAQLCKQKLGSDGLIKREGVSIKTQLEHAFGGTPDQQPEKYIDHASFTADYIDGGNAKYLRNLPVKLYCEQDLDFVRKTYCNKLQQDDINATNLDALHKFLINARNNRCEYITTKGRGFHSWNIIDPEKCVDWVMTVSL